jgi:glycosyltransferase involved in cell wall biosynthesis
VSATHTFVVPAFGEPQWLDRCVHSLQQQTVPSRILITTSTPNAYLSEMSARHRVPLVVNPISAGIASDWNFALQHAESEWVSLAHQDDWYEADFLECSLDAARGMGSIILVFTAATELREGDTRSGANSLVKRAICATAFLSRPAITSAVQKRLLLSFGNPIPCPSVMLNRRVLHAFTFPGGWKSNLDWIAWLQLAGEPGAFAYVPRPLVHRTLHENAATTRQLADRRREDDLMFRRLWPAPIAAALSRVYAASRRPYRTLRRE